MRLLSKTALSLAVPVLLALTSMRALAADQPSWVEHPPAPNANYVYAVGAGTAWNRARAQKRAQTDALRNLAAQVGITISSEMLDIMSTRESENLTRSSTESRTQARIQEAKLVDEVLTCHRIWPFRRCEAHALYQWSRSALSHEQKRQMDLDESERLFAASGRGEIERLNRLMKTDLDPDMLVAVQQKAWAVDDAWREYNRLIKEPAPSSAEVSDYIAQLRRIDAMDLRKMAKDVRWGREHGMPYPDQESMDKLERGLRQAGYYKAAPSDRRQDDGTSAGDDLESRLLNSVGGNP